MTRVKILHVGEKWTAEGMICPPKHKFSPLWMRSLLAAKEKGWLKAEKPRPFVKGQGCNHLLPNGGAAERRAAALALLLNRI